MTENRTPSPSPRSARKPAAEVAPPAAAAQPAKPAECNLRSCGEPPEWRGLCSAHRQTHRGLADPKGK